MRFSLTVPIKVRRFLPMVGLKAPGDAADEPRNRVSRGTRFEAVLRARR
jgi:hypothetical protein